MKAVVITRPGDPEVLELREVPDISPGPGQVRVRVEAAGLNRADLLQRRGLYPAPPGAPRDIPGLEYAGRIDAVGAGVQLRKPGDRVMGIVAGGAFAEAVVVHERETISIPTHISSSDAAAIPEAFLTAYDALIRQCGMTSGDRVLIHAVGSGVGLAGLQLAHTLGCITLGSSRTPSKLEAAARFGLDHPILNGDQGFSDACLEATAGVGVQVVMDFFGASALEQNLKVLAAGGRMVLVGLMGGPRAPIDLSVLLTKRLMLRGTTLRARPLEEKIQLAREFEAHLLHMFETGRLIPVVDRVLDMHQVREAHQRMEANETFGKVVLTW